MIRQLINCIRQLLRSTEPMDCFILQLNVLRVFGAYQDPSKNKSPNLLTIFSMFLILKLCALSVIYLLSPNVSLEDKLQSSFTANTSLLCCIEWYYIRKHSMKWFTLAKGLKNRINDSDENESKATPYIVLWMSKLHSTNLEYVVVLLHRGAIYPTAIAYLALQSAIMMSCSIYAFFPVGRSNYDKPLPVYAWYPQYFSEGTPYKVVFLLQYISITFAGTLWVCVDTVNFGLLAHHNVMLKILSQRISKIGWTDNRRPDYNAKTYQKLCECVKYHIQILNYQSETNQIYGSIFFAKITLSVVIICSFVYTLSLKTLAYGSFIAQFSIFSVIISTMFVLSWMSEQISAESENLLNKAMECNFQCLDRRTTKALLIFMQGLSPTVYIEVGATFKVVLNLKTFVKIIDFAYKCLTLLKTVAS